jgi:vitamin B12 transporter
MKKQLIFVSILVCSIANIQLFAQEKVEKLDEIVVTATKFHLKKENTGKVIYKITQEEIEQNAGKTVTDLLNNIPGIEIKGTNSNLSEPRSTFFRGGRSRQVLVLIDGIPVSDPSGINQEYDLRLLALNQIEKIEILKGASSTLYGSGAATGVINIILKKAKKDNISSSFETSIGTNNAANTSSSIFSDKNQNINVNGNINDFNFLSSFSLTGTGGLSSAKSTIDQDFESDLYNGKNGLLKLGYQFNKEFSIQTFMNFDAFSYDYDAAIYTDSEVNNGEQTQWRFGVKPRFVYTSGEVYLLASFNKVKRTDANFNSFSNELIASVFEGESMNIDLVNKYDFSNKIQLITGINYQEHNNNTTSIYGNIDKGLANFNTIDPYASAVYISDFGLNINLGGRLNIHSNYGKHLVYDANVSYHLVKNDKITTKLLSSYSSAFIAPSTYQLFSVYGNNTLNPETSKTLEFGFETAYKGLLELNVVYFNRNENNAILFENLAITPWGMYANSSESINISGVETLLTVTPMVGVKLNIGYTYTNKKEDVDYIPTDKLVANLELKPTNNSFVSFVYKNVGERSASYFDNNTFTTAQASLPTYNLLDLNANYKFMEQTVVIFGTISNIFNEDYEEILGYSTRGRNYKLGLRLQF